MVADGDFRFGLTDASDSDDEGGHPRDTVWVVGNEGDRVRAFTGAKYWNRGEGPRTGTRLLNYCHACDFCIACW